MKGSIMEKKVIHIFLVAITGVMLWSCNGNGVPDCVQNAGEIVWEEVELPSFQKITVFEGVELILSGGTQQQVIIETGEYLRNEVSAEVDGNRLVLRNENNCNLFRPYGITRVFVTSPNIDEVRSSTGWPVRSEGVLSYSSLALISESFNNPETETTDGSFDLNVDVQDIQLIANGIAYFRLRGIAQRFNATIAAGDSRVEAENLIAGEVVVNHRGSNDILVNPQQSLAGVIRGTGNVLSYNRPDTVSVEELYRGKLIFID
jgi:hypothetical protein